MNVLASKHTKAKADILVEKPRRSRRFVSRLLQTGRPIAPEIKNEGLKHANYQAHNE